MDIWYFSLFKTVFFKEAIMKRNGKPVANGKHYGVFIQIRDFYLVIYVIKKKL